MTTDHPRSTVAARLLAALGVVAIVLLGMAPSASAHSVDQSYLFLDVTERALTGEVELNYADVSEVLGLSLDGSADENLAELESNFGLLESYVRDHLVIGDDWSYEVEGVELLSIEGFDDTGFAVLPIAVDPGTDATPRQFPVTFDPFFDEIEGRDALLIISNDWSGGVVDNEADWLLRFAAGSRTQTVDLDDAGWTKNLVANIDVGVDHIRTGPDHIFFIFVLLLPSVLVFRRRWWPSASFGSSLWRILKIVTMFTIAHSITFTLAGLDLIPLPSPKVVETVIAVSIAVAALHNIRPVVANREWLIAFIFGLFHGMGFASLLSELDASRSTQLVSLVGRNLGIEIGQAVVVLLVFPALFLLRRTIPYVPAMKIASALLGTLAMAWAVERIFELDFGTNDLAERIVKFPRSLFIVVAVTLAAAAYRRFEERRGRLLPVDDGGRADGPPDDMTTADAELVPEWAG